MPTYRSAEDVPNTVLQVRDAEGGLWGRVRDSDTFAALSGGAVLPLAEVIDLYGPVEDATGESR